VRWWDEEFWATAAITFASVAVTIGLTVWISWWVLNRQLAHERDSQRIQREEQLADLREELSRDRRIRHAAGLPELLDEWAKSVSRLATSYAQGERMDLVYTHVSGDLSNALPRLQPYRARLRTDPSASAALDDLLQITTLWHKAGHGQVNKPPDPSTKEAFRSIGAELASAIHELELALPAWEDSGQLTLSERPALLTFVQSGGSLPCRGASAAGAVNT
jgi:hypothetical protein